MLKQPIEKSWLYTFYAFGIFSLGCILAAIYTYQYLLAAIPIALLFLYLCVNDFRFVYMMMLASIPLSTEIALPGGFATDLPSEPLVVGLMFLFLAFILTRPEALDKRFLMSPLVFLLLIHFFWIIFSSVYSSNPYVSAKFTLAKTWYIIVFVFATAVIIRNVNEFRTAFWCLFIPMLGTAIYVLIRHSRFGFSFESVNWQTQPFYRNHVNYACTLAQMVPFIFLAISWYKDKKVIRRVLKYSLLIFIVAIYFSYTRSAWLSLVVAAIMFLVIREKLLSWLLGAGLVVVIGFFVYMSANDHYLKLEPDYEHTIYHPELGEHLASTFEGQDVSSAERIYRWVAGVRMWLEKPVVGYGPGNFYNFYKSYTVNSFMTYVSDNPEKSSIHNYFLLLLAEQGIIGLGIFLILTVVILIKGQQIYHQTTSIAERRYVMALLLCLIIIYVNTFLSDLIETDKIGSFYFICIALLVNQDVRNKKLEVAGMASNEVTKGN